jgi:hypothetical protein
MRLKKKPLWLACSVMELIFPKLKDLQVGDTLSLRCKASALKLALNDPA